MPRAKSSVRKPQVKLPLTAKVLRRGPTARYIGVSPRWLDELRQDPDAHFPPHIVLGGKAIGWLVEDLDRWLESRRSSAGPALAASAGMEYLTRLPPTLPADRILVHNVRTRPGRRLGSHGFRAWLADAAHPEQWDPCDCEWAWELGPHFRTRPPEPREATADEAPAGPVSPEAR